MSTRIVAFLGGLASFWGLGVTNLSMAQQTQIESPCSVMVGDSPGANVRVDCTKPPLPPMPVGSGPLAGCWQGVVTNWAPADEAVRINIRHVDKTIIGYSALDYDFLRAGEVVFTSQEGLKYTSDKNPQRVDNIVIDKIPLRLRDSDQVKDFWGHLDVGRENSFSFSHFKGWGQFSVIGSFTRESKEPCGAVPNPLSEKEDSVEKN